MPTFTAPSQGDHLTFTLTVADTLGSEDTDTVVITVADMNDPTADAGEAQTVAPGDSVTPGWLQLQRWRGGYRHLEWMRERGTTVTLTGANTNTATFTAPSTAGEIIFE